MSLHRHIFLLLATAGLSVLGCHRTTSDLPQETSDDRSEVTHGLSSHTNEIESNHLTLEIGDEGDLERLLQKHRGKVVMVDFWATWCSPCVRQFPHTVEMSRKFGDQLAVVAVSMDDPDDIEKVRFFLNNQRVQFDNLIASYGVGQEAFEAFQIENGSVPHYKLYDKNGQLHQTADDNENLETWIQELLR